MFLTPGLILRKRYRIDRLIAEGGMGRVYLACDLKAGHRPVAIKALETEAEDPELFVRRFKREARILSSLEHPGLVQVLDFFEESGDLYLVMEYIDGETLAKSVNGPASAARIDQVLEWMHQLVEVVRYLHHHDPPIIVRDLKPTNMLLEKASQRLRLIDFGIAREMSSNADITLKGGIGVTPGFAPPEQYGRATDERSDLYALGATMYSLMAAKIPHSAPARMAGNLTPPLSDVNPAVALEVSHLVDCLMELEPETRPQTIDEVASRLAVATAAQRAGRQQHAETLDIVWPEWAIPLTQAKPTHVPSQIAAEDASIETPATEPKGWFHRAWTKKQRTRRG